MGCNYLSLPSTPASCTQVHNWCRCVVPAQVYILYVIISISFVAMIQMTLNVLYRIFNKLCIPELSSRKYSKQRLSFKKQWRAYMPPCAFGTSKHGSSGYSDCVWLDQNQNEWQNIMFLFNAYFPKTLHDADSLVSRWRTARGRCDKKLRQFVSSIHNS